MKCGKPYCACVGTCFAQHSPLDDAGQLKGHPMTTNEHTEQSERAELIEALTGCRGQEAQIDACHKAAALLAADKSAYRAGYTAGYNDRFLGRVAADKAAEHEIEQLIRERDHREEIINRLCDAVLGSDRSEWSSSYHFEDAVREVEEAMAEDKAGGEWTEEVMRQWDYWRAEIAAGNKTSAPRDWFESLAGCTHPQPQPDALLAKLDEAMVHVPYSSSGAKFLRELRTMLKDKP